MMNLPLSLYDLMPTLSTVAAAGTETTESWLKIGYIVLTIIIAPVVILGIASLFSHPRVYRIQLIHFGSLLVLASMLIIGFALMGWVLKFFIPQ